MSVALRSRGRVLLQGAHYAHETAASCGTPEAEDRSCQRTRRSHRARSVIQFIGVVQSTMARCPRVH